MKLNKLLFLSLCCLLFASCSFDSQQDIPDIGYHIKESDINLLLAELESNNQGKAEAYRNRIEELTLRISADWKTQPNKLLINGYVKSETSEDVYTGYMYRDNKLVKLTTVPQHITDSFDRVYSCYSPDYWQQFPEKVRSVAFFHNTDDKEVRFELIQLK